MAIDKELIDELLGNDKRPKDRIGEKGLLKEFSRRLFGVVSALPDRSSSSR